MQRPRVEVGVFDLKFGSPPVRKAFRVLLLRISTRGVRRRSGYFPDFPQIRALSSSRRRFRRCRCRLGRRWTGQRNGRLLRPRVVWDYTVNVRLREPRGFVQPLEVCDLHLRTAANRCLGPLQLQQPHASCSTCCHLPPRAAFHKPKHLRANSALHWTRLRLAASVHRPRALPARGAAAE